MTFTASDLPERAGAGGNGGAVKDKQHDVRSFCPSLSVSFRCAVDNTVKFIHTADKRTQRFSIEAFSFVGDHQFVYMHCKVMVCNAADPHSRCAQGCVRRGKRSLITQESNDEEINMSQGPFMRGDDEEETKLEKTEQDMRDARKSSKFLFIFVSTGRDNSCRDKKTIWDSSSVYT